MISKRRRKVSEAQGRTEARPASEFSSIESVLKSALKQSGLDEKISRYNFVLRWPEIVGAEIARRTRPDCIRGKTLVVRVEDSVWAQELSFHKQAILVRLKRYLKDDETLEDVVFIVGEIGSSGGGGNGTREGIP